MECVNKPYQGDRGKLERDSTHHIVKIAFLVLHMKQGLFQKFVKSLTKGSNCCKFICYNIKKSQETLRNNVFTGPEIKLLVARKDFPETMTDRKHVTKD